MTKILITGATGFLGGAIAAQLLEENRLDEMLLLVRGATADDGWRRMAERLRLFDVAEEKITALRAQHLLLGDIAQVPSFAKDPRLQDVTAVINCAAVTSFGDNPKIWPINVEATMAFAESASHWPNLKRFLHVGTAMACGVQSESPVPEYYDAGEAAEHLVPYTKSKAAVEVRMRAELPDMPLVVARPSIVVGHTRLGCKPSPSIFWVFRMVKALEEFLCGYEDRLDVIPVDYCASALIKLATKSTLKHDRYHISAGTAASNSVGEIDRGISQALGVDTVRGYRQVSYDQIVTRQGEFAKLFGDCNRRLILRAIKLYGGFASLNILFDNQRLLAEGIPLSPRFVDYIGACTRTSINDSIAQQMKFDFK